MVAALIVSYDGNTTRNTIASTSQDFFFLASGGNQVVGAGVSGSSESDAQLPYPAGSITNLQCTVKTAATGTSTVRLRKAGANGNNTFSIGSGTTGHFQDSTPHTDTTNSGDLICVGVTAGSTALFITVIAATFSASNTGNTVVKGVAVQGITSQEVSNTYYSTPFGVTGSGSNFNTTEADAKLRIRKTISTINNLCGFITGIGGTTCSSRKNGGAGNLTMNTNVGSAQLVQDTTHSDSATIGDDYNYTFGGSLTFDGWSADYISTNGDCIFSCGNDMLTTFNTSVTAFFGLSGALDTSQTTETNAQVTVNNAYKFSELTCNITSNSITSATSVTIRLRANSGNTNLAISAINNQTGVLSDSTAADDYTSAPTDSMNYSVVTGATGTSLKMSFISVWGNATPAPAGGGPMYQHFRNVSKPLGRQDYNSFGGQMIVFG